MKNKFLSIVFVLSVLCAFMPLIASAATRGTCGENVTWTLDDYGTLTISGTGNMTRWGNTGSNAHSPFRDNQEIERVVIEEGVTNIGARAFESCSNIKKITIADSVEYIGNYAFLNCSNLKKITIPNGVTSIGTCAFGNCSNLENITISDSVKYIYDYAFKNCDNITRVTIPISITSIDKNIFYECNNLKDVYYNGTEEQWNKISISSENDELNSATIHYKRDIPLTTATITKTETSEGYTFYVEPEQTYKTCYVYAAAYDENGVLVKMNCVPLEMSGSTTISIDKTDKVKSAKVFVLSDMLQPVIQAQEFNIE